MVTNGCIIYILYISRVLNLLNSVRRGLFCTHFTYKTTCNRRPQKKEKRICFVQWSKRLCKCNVLVFIKGLKMGLIHMFFLIWWYFGKISTTVDNNFQSLQVFPSNNPVWDAVVFFRTKLQSKLLKDIAIGKYILFCAFGKIASD